MGANDDAGARYDAFLSYRHLEPDRKWAKWLHAAMENYRVPRELVAKGFPTRLRRVFRDEEELPAHPDLSSAIVGSLRDSRFLIVICSPRTPASQWVNAEVEEFRRLGRNDRILTLLIEGEPVESFPKALTEIRRTLIDAHGATSEQIEEVEPLAADVRLSRKDERPSDLRHRARLRLIASVLGCRFDDLRRRDLERRTRRRRNTVMSVALASVIVLGLVCFGLWQRDKAIEAGEAERRQAYLADMRDASATWRTGRVEDLRRMLARYQGDDSKALRGFEWHFWQAVIENRTGIVLEPAGSGVVGSAFVGSGKRLLVLDESGAIRAWNLETRTRDPLPDLAASMKDYLARATTPIPEASENHAAETQKPAEPLIPMVFASIHPFGAGDECLLTPRPGAASGTIALLVNTHDWRIVTVLGLTPFTTCLAASASGAGLLNADEVAHIYDLRDGASWPNNDITRGYRDHMRGVAGNIAHGAITAMALGPDEQCLAVGYADGVVQVWDLVLRLSSDTPRIVTTSSVTHVGIVSGLAFSRDGGLIASQSLGMLDDRVADLASAFRPGELAVWRRSDGVPLWVANPHERKLSPAASGLRSSRGPAFSADDSRLYSTGDRGVHVWDFRTGTSLGLLAGCDGAADAVAVSRDGRRIAGVGADGSLRLWESSDALDSRDVGSAEVAIRKLGISVDGQRIAVLRDSGQEKRHGDVRRAQLPQSVPSGFDAVRVLDLSGRVVASLSGATARLGFGPPSHGPFNVIGRESSVGPNDTYDRTAVRFRDQLYSPDGRVGLEERGQDVVMSWPDTGSPPVQLDGHTRDPRSEGAAERSPHFMTATDPASRALSCAAFSPNSKVLATGDGTGVLRIWSTADGSLIRRVDAHAGAVSALSWNSSSTLLASGGLDRKGVVWAAPSLEMRLRLTGHRREVSGITFLGGDDRIVTSAGHPHVAGRDPGEVIVWELQGGQQCLVLTLPRPAAFADVVATPDGSTIVAAANYLDAAGEAMVVAWSCQHPGK